MYLMCIFIQIFNKINGVNLQFYSQNYTSNSWKIIPFMEKLLFAILKLHYNFYIASRILYVKICEQDVIFFHFHVP